MLSLILSVTLCNIVIAVTVITVHTFALNWLEYDSVGWNYYRDI